LAGLGQEEIRKWVEMPDDEKPELQVLCKAFDWMIQDAQYTTVQEMVGQAALFDVNRKGVSSEPQKPFDSWMDIDTGQRYTQAEKAEAEKRPAYNLTGRQQIALYGVREVIQEFQEWKKDQPIDDSITNLQVVGVHYDASLPGELLRRIRLGE
jgi:hypothetical protein